MELNVRLSDIRKARKNATKGDRKILANVEHNGYRVVVYVQGRRHGADNYLTIHKDGLEHGSYIFQVTREITNNSLLNGMLVQEVEWLIAKAENDKAKLLELFNIQYSSRKVGE